MVKVIPFTGITRLDLSVEAVLERVRAADLEGIVVLGFRKDTKAPDYFASTYADGGTVLWLLEICKKRLLGDE